MNNTVGRFAYSTTSGTSLEVAVTSTGGTFSTIAGFSRGSTTSASVKIPSGNNNNYEWWISERFRAYDIMCSTGTSTYTSGYREWRPELYTGSAGGRAWTVFSCNSTYRSTLQRGAVVQVASGRTATNTSAFAVGGGLMRTQQVWDSTESVQYQAETTSTPFALCGYNGYYTQSVSRTREVP